MVVVGPLEEIRHILSRFSMFLGFPLIVRGKRADIIEFDKTYTYKAAVLALVKVTPIMAIVLWVYHDPTIDVDDFRSIARSYGLSAMDILAQFILNAVAMISNFLFFTSFTLQRHKMSNLCQNLSQLSVHFPIRSMAVQSRRKSTKYTCLINVISILAVFFLGWSWHLLCEEYFPTNNPVLKWLTLVTLCAQAIFGFCSAMICAAEYLLHYMITILSLHFFAWSQMIEKLRPMTLGDTQTESTEKKDLKKPEADFQAIINHGLSLCEVVDEFNHVFGMFVLNSGISSALSAVISSYISKSILFQPKIGVLVICFSASFGLLGAFFFLRIFFLSRAGQALIDGKQQALKSLEDHLLSQPETRADQDFRLGVLIRRLGTKEAISPQNFFTLSNRSFLSGMGVILTYLIVLMQFKASEGPDYPVLPNNLTLFKLQ
ncbi:hypothetical protein TCAL_16703 [Tigriopus californicus]|uniref:Gustatory receptor n=1 Tax=Tigriopus californicus TaxID=6832 RepID=A0A553PK21_TIGCA|nr:hypothetical protein TCAL_16703 [Tigriopus californicus]